MSTERLAKVIARSGIASRREAERLIEDGHVKVNSKVQWHPGHPVDPAVDLVVVHGQPLPKPPPNVYFLLNKPRGYVTGRDDPEGRKSVLELVEHLPFRVEPVGRLDLNTEGALLLTNDGPLAHALTHPSGNVPKRYLVKVWKRPSDRALNRIRAGLRLEDGRTKPARLRITDATDSGNTWIEVTVTEGRNRLIRRLFEAVGHPVSKLRRLSFATIALRGLERGELRPLAGDELERLREVADGKDPATAGHSSRYKKGYARPKPKPNKPLSRKRNTAGKGRKPSTPKTRKS